MANYTGKKCFSCGEVFKDGDDIVVCPECGTPYHRECYLKEGKCINDALHESCQSWEQTQESVESENIRCIRCGFENPPDKLFCEKCGTPLTKMILRNVHSTTWTRKITLSRPALTDSLTVRLADRLYLIRTQILKALN